MNLLTAIQTFLPRAAVDKIVAGVPKTPELIGAERDLAENASAQLAATKRLAEIYELLNVASPVRRPIFKAEEDQLQAERADLNKKVGELADRARQLRHEIADLMPAHAQAVAAALAGFRRRAAEQLLDSVSAAEEALEDIRQSNKALIAVGMSPPAAFALPYSAALKGLSDKILKERV